MRRSRRPQLEAAAFSASIAEYRNVDVCVPPVREEPLVGLDACGNVADHRMGARKTQRRNGMERRERVGASMIENALEFRCGVEAQPQLQVGVSTQVDRNQCGDEAKLVGTTRGLATLETRKGDAGGLRSRATEDATDDYECTDG